MKLLDLFQANASRPRSYAIEAKDDDEATVYLYDAIGGWFGVEAKTFIKDLQAVKAKTIHLRINSPGGDVFEARAMATAIRQHGSKVVAHIDGLAASAATYVAIAADEVRIAKGAFFMVHHAWTLAMGNAAELRDTAGLLDKIDDTIAADYEERTGKDRAQIVEWMDAETWFTAEEALEHGFVDSVYEGKKADASWDVSAYSNAPKNFAAAADPAYDRATLERRLAMLERVAQ